MCVCSHSHIHTECLKWSNQCAEPPGRNGKSSLWIWVEEAASGEETGHDLAVGKHAESGGKESKNTTQLLIKHSQKQNSPCAGKSRLVYSCEPSWLSVSDCPHRPVTCSPFCVPFHVSQERHFSFISAHPNTDPSSPRHLTHPCQSDGLNKVLLSLFWLIKKTNKQKAISWSLLLPQQASQNRAKIPPHGTWRPSEPDQLPLQDSHYPSSQVLASSKKSPALRLPLQAIPSMWHLWLSISTCPNITHPSLRLSSPVGPNWGLNNQLLPLFLSILKVL